MGVGRCHPHRAVRTVCLLRHVHTAAALHGAELWHVRRLSWLPGPFVHVSSLLHPCPWRLPGGLLPGQAHDHCRVLPVLHCRPVPLGRRGLRIAQTPLRGDAPDDPRVAADCTRDWGDQALCLHPRGPADHLGPQRQHAGRRAGHRELLPLVLLEHQYGVPVWCGAHVTDRSEVRVWGDFPYSWTHADAVHAVGVVHPRPLPSRPSPRVHAGGLLQHRLERHHGPAEGAAEPEAAALAGLGGPQVRAGGGGRGEARDRPLQDLRCAARLLDALRQRFKPVDQPGQADGRPCGT
mmetsp:Transcript_43143/g.77549  ORF Transcript_43143/g.77549 Transcript_43143/m.77549 type:complete len:293 (-) Transcript_43143:81-959(-)